MPGANYGGTQPATSANVKSYVTGSLPDTWKYATINGVKMLTMASSKDSLYLQNNLTVHGDLTVDGVINCVSCTPSDENLKHDVSEITLEDKMAAMQLIPRKFVFNSDTTETPHYGFIAQQVEPLLPNLVIDTKSNGTKAAYKSVNYVELIPLLLANIQDMQEQINDLKNTLKSYEKKRG